jgi:mannose-6-phosphate isomerase-like protein (cupin superfamily)
MLVRHADPTVAKGWYAGPWNSSLSVSVGYANAGIDEPHVHTRLTGVYMVGRGTSEIRIEETTVTLEVGDVIVVEPGEAHTFLSSSPDYFHFVAHVPGLPAEEVRAEKLSIPRSRLAL